ncbi:Uncharacterised protein [uncultured archaeon]|nr:Uncharacterised protein [uncultured archaeon]
MFIFQTGTVPLSVVSISPKTGDAALSVQQAGFLTGSAKFFYFGAKTLWNAMPFVLTSKAIKQARIAGGAGEHLLATAYWTEAGTNLALDATIIIPEIKGAGMVGQFTKFTTAISRVTFKTLWAESKALAKSSANLIKKIPTMTYADAKNSFIANAEKIAANEIKAAAKTTAEQTIEYEGKEMTVSAAWKQYAKNLAKKTNILKTKAAERTPAEKTWLTKNKTLTPPSVDNSYQVQDVLKTTLKNSKLDVTKEASITENALAKNNATTKSFTTVELNTIKQEALNNAVKDVAEDIASTTVKSKAKTATTSVGESLLTKYEEHLNQGIKDALKTSGTGTALPEFKFDFSFTMDAMKSNWKSVKDLPWLPWLTDDKAYFKNMHLFYQPKWVAAAGFPTWVKAPNPFYPIKVYTNLYLRTVAGPKSVFFTGLNDYVLDPWLERALKNPPKKTVVLDNTGTTPAGTTTTTTTPVVTTAPTVVKNTYSVDLGTKQPNDTTKIKELLKKAGITVENKQIRNAELNEDKKMVMSDSLGKPVTIDYNATAKTISITSETTVVKETATTGASVYVNDDGSYKLKLTGSVFGTADKSSCYLQIDGALFTIDLFKSGDAYISEELRAYVKKGSTVKVSSDNATWYTPK